MFYRYLYDIATKEVNTVRKFTRNAHKKERTFHHVTDAFHRCKYNLATSSLYPWTFMNYVWNTKNSSICIYEKFYGCIFCNETYMKYVWCMKR